MLYIGAAIGFANKVLLFTNFLTQGEVGLANIMITNAVLYAQFSALGFSTMTLRFFPYFQDKERKHHHFLFWLLAIPTLGFVVVTLLVVAFQQPIFDYFNEKSPLMVEYFWYLIPLSLATLYFELFDAYLRSLKKSVVPVLFREIIQRIFIAVAILCYALKWVDFPNFVMLYVALLSSVTLLMVIYTYWLGQLHLPSRPTWRLRQLGRKMLVYGGFNFIGNFSSFLIFSLDAIMLARYVGMDAVGVYTTSMYMSVLITIPWRAFQKIAAPVVVTHWKNRDMPAMQELYQRTSLLNLMAGLFLFLSMVALQDVMFAVMPTDYRTGFTVFLILGAGRVLDMLTGLNGYMLVTSKYYRVDLFMALLLTAFAVVLNNLLIPPYGIEGAAWATSLTLCASNLFRVIFIAVMFRLQPFSWRMLQLTGISGLAFLAFFLVSSLVPDFLGKGLGYLVFLGIFGGLSLGMKVVPDVNAYLKTLLQRFA